MRFVGESYKDKKIDMDFNEFVDCEFTKCELVFHGVGKIGMEGCSFSSVRWTFADAAANTVQFMTALYHGAGPGGKQLIESTFENIRAGSDRPVEMSDL